MCKWKYCNGFVCDKIRNQNKRQAKTRKTKERKKKKNFGRKSCMHTIWAHYILKDYAVFHSRLLIIIVITILHRAPRVVNCERKQNTDSRHRNGRTHHSAILDTVRFDVVAVVVVSIWSIHTYTYAHTHAYGKCTHTHLVLSITTTTSPLHWPNQFARQVNASPSTDTFLAIRLLFPYKSFCAQNFIGFMKIALHSIWNSSKEWIVAIFATVKCVFFLNFLSDFLQRVTSVAGKRYNSYAIAMKKSIHVRCVQFVVNETSKSEFECDYLPLSYTILQQLLKSNTIIHDLMLKHNVCKKYSQCTQTDKWFIFRIILDKSSTTV